MLIEAYKKLWPRRSSAVKINSVKELEKQILVELNDELTHPRVRKTKQEKFEIALARIEQSELSEEEKAELRSIYKKIAAH